MPDATRPTVLPTSPATAAGIPEALLAELQALVRGNETIEAIKRYRSATGASLVAAKQVIGDLAAGRTPRPLSPPLSGRAWQVRANVPFTLAKAAGVLRLFAAFTWLCALLAAGAAGWEAYERHVVNTAWPEVEAQVVRCRAIERYRSRRRIDLWTMKEAARDTALACTFRFRARGQEYTAETRSHSTDRPALVAAMHAWVVAHPPGAMQSIRYDPADPRRISLGDADAGFEPDTTEHRIDLAVLFGAVGVVFLGGGMWLEAIRRRREASAGGPT